MKKVFLYNDWHNGDVLTNRCLIQELVKHDLQITVGSYRNRHYLVADLPVRHVLMHVDENAPHSPTLAALCPEDHVRVNGWCGTFHDLDNRPSPLGAHNWANVVDTWNRQSEMYGLGVTLSSKRTPTIDLPVLPVRVLGRGIYVENGDVRSGHSEFDFPLHEMAAAFPGFTFYCTAQPRIRALPEVYSNIVSLGKKNLIQLASVSTHCEAILGKCSGPFMCTLSAANRLKPKAVVGFTAKKFWVSDDNPIDYLPGETEVFEFLRRVWANPPEVV